MKEIPLTQGFVALVDDEDYETLAHFKWCAVRYKRTCIYAARLRRIAGVPRHLTMHRLILGEPASQVDHINGNGLDNRRANLRLATNQQNQANQRPRGGTSRFKGVWLQNGRWCVRIGLNGARVYLGSFESEHEAARAYDVAARNAWGDFARTNFE